jgi:hypothetical protein
MSKSSLKPDLVYDTERYKGKNDNPTIRAEEVTGLARIFESHCQRG